MPITLLQSNKTNEAPGRMARRWSDFASLGDWTSYVGGTGAAVLATGTGYADASRCGVLSCDTGTTTTGYAGVGDGATDQVTFGTRPHYLSVVARIPTLPTVAENFKIVLGYWDRRNSATPTDGVLLWMTQANPTWQMEAYSNTATIGSVNTGVTADTSWHRYDIFVSSTAGTAQFWIDGVYAGQVSAGLPTGTTRATGVSCHIIKSAGTTSRQLLVDSLLHEMDTAR